MDGQNLNLILSKLQSIDSRLKEQEERLLVLEGGSEQSSVEVEQIAQQLGISSTSKEIRTSSGTRDGSEGWIGKIVVKVGIITVLAGVVLFLIYSFFLL